MTTTLSNAPDSTQTRARRRASRRIRSTLAMATAGLLLFAGCATSSEAAPSETTSDADAVTTSATDDDQSTQGDVDLFDSRVVHTIDVDFDQADYDAMIESFTSTGDKEWISATVTIDGTAYENVGLRLKGNSSLFGLTSATSGNPEDLPWLIRLNKFVDGEDHQDYEDIVIRSNSTETALNEAVAQELLAAAGLAAQTPIATAFTVNGGETELRLAVENPDEEWYEDNFTDADGLLYKADSEGDYSYRGEDAEDYIDVFEQEVGDDDMAPLIDFLDFINNADDINGRGNNSYLQYDTTVDQFTVVSWDLNLAFGTANVGGGGAGNRPAGPPPEATDGAALPDRGVAPGEPVGANGVDGGGDVGGGGVGGPGGEANILVDRFMANDDFAGMYAAKTDELNEALFVSGTVDEVIANWADVLINGAVDLVSEETVAAEAAALIGYVDGVR